MNTNNVTIKKAILTAGHGLRLVMSERQKDGTYVDSTSDYSAAVHPDLKEAFRRLNVHLALVSEYISSEDVEDIDKPEQELMDKYYVSSITYLPDDAGAKISGTVELTNGKNMPLSPPTVKWDDDPAYGYSSEMSEITALVMAEIKSYLGGKHAPEPQPELPFTEPAETQS